MSIPSGLVPGVAIANANHIAHLQRVVGPVVHHGVLTTQRQVGVKRLGDEERLTQGLSDGGQAGIVQTHLGPVGGNESQRPIGREGLQVGVPTLRCRGIDDLKGVLTVLHHTEGA